MNTAIDTAALTAAQNYERMVVPGVMRPVTRILLEQAKPEPGERVLDVAAGTGIVARTVAHIVGPLGRVAAVDVNPAMIAVGQAQPDGTGVAIEWREGNAQAVPLPDGEFDLVLCQHGMQYFPDRVDALREMRRVLKPSGRVAFVVWGKLAENPISQILWGGISHHLGVPPEKMTPAFSLGDPEELRWMTETAGFQATTVTQRSLITRRPWGPNELVSLLGIMRKFAPALDAMSDEERAELARHIGEEINPLFGDAVQGGELVDPASVLVATARA